MHVFVTGATGAKVLRGTLDDLDTLRRAAWTADAVIHSAFNHDFSRFIENCAQDRRVIEAFESVLRGVPVESRPREHFGWFANMAGADMAVSSEQTRERLKWTPVGPGLLADLDEADYFRR